MKTAILCIEDSYFSRIQWLDVKNVLMLDLSQLLSSPDVNWWTGVVWIIVMFLSDSHSDGTHSLQSIHCWDTDAFLQTWWRNKLILILDGPRVSKCSANIHTGVNYCFKQLKIEDSCSSASYETMQCAAVITHWLWIRVPPQMCLLL